MAADVVRVGVGIVVVPATAVRVIVVPVEGEIDGT